MRALGNCGDEVPDGNLLPVLVGPGVSRCPVATTVDDPDILMWASLVPGPDGPGPLAGVARYLLPPRLRAVFDLADGWMAAFKAREVANA